MFDHLYAVAEGKCIFSGATNSLIPFLSDLDLICPESYNPTDYRECDSFLSSLSHADFFFCKFIFIFL